MPDKYRDPPELAAAGPAPTSGPYVFREEIDSYAWSVSFATHGELMAFLAKYRPNVKPIIQPTAPEQTVSAVTLDEQPRRGREFI
jgi:hypothetical protein